MFLQTSEVLRIDGPCGGKLQKKSWNNPERVAAEQHIVSDVDAVTTLLSCASLVS